MGSDAWLWLRNFIRARRPGETLRASVRALSRGSARGDGDDDDRDEAVLVRRTGDGRMETVVGGVLAAEAEEEVVVGAVAGVAASWAAAEVAGGNGVASGLIGS